MLMLGAETDVIFQSTISRLRALHFSRAQFLCSVLGFAYSWLPFLYVRVAFAWAHRRFLFSRPTLH
jgi:hypothetical protein